MIDLFFPPTIRHTAKAVLQDPTKAEKKRQRQREACARWRAKNKDKTKALNAVRKEKYDMYAMVKAWRAKNPEKRRAQWMRRSARLKTLTRSPQL